MLRSQSSPTPDAHAVRGYLNRFKTQLIGKSWEQRYFVLRYGQLHVHLSEREFTNSVSHNAPFSLRDCTIIDTGTRKQGRFHTFAISHPSRTWAYLGTQLGNHGGLFLRLSCESEAEKSQWLLLLRSAALGPSVTSNAGVAPPTAAPKLQPSASVPNLVALGHTSASGSLGGGRPSLYSLQNPDNTPGAQSYGSSPPPSRPCTPSMLPLQSQPPSPLPSPRTTTHAPLPTPIATLAMTNATPSSMPDMLFPATPEAKTPERPRRKAANEQQSSPSALSIGHEVGGSLQRKQALPPKPPLQQQKRQRRHSTTVKGHAHVHREARPSLLSPEATVVSGHRGLLNLGGIVLFVLNSRLIVENLFNYGLRFNVRWLLAMLDVPKLCVLVTLVLLFWLSLGIELWAVSREKAHATACATQEKKEEKRQEQAEGGVVSSADVVAAPQSEMLVMVMHVLLVSTAIVLPTTVVWTADDGSLVDAVLMLCGVTAAMKLMSYAHVNRSMRRAERWRLHARAQRELQHRSARRATKPGSRDDTSVGARSSQLSSCHSSALRQRRSAAVSDVSTLPKPVSVKRALQRTLSMPAHARRSEPLAWPQNLTLSSVMFFVAVPTLCYQVEYPRTRRVRRVWLAKRILELLTVALLMAFMVLQYWMPVLSNVRFTQGRGVHTVSNTGGDARGCAAGATLLLERVLKISVPVLYAWLLMFVGFFHLWFNVLAELTRFADRQFYKDWWNATNLEEYWRKWNLPVHNWLVRHVYFPCLRAGLSKMQAQLVVFFLSAALHELVISVPCRTVRLWAFIGMFAQAPLVLLTKKIEGVFGKSQLGNYFFWVTFCIFGQPLCVLLYYFDVSIVSIVEFSCLHHADGYSVRH